jgi:hypothetical protein
VIRRVTIQANATGADPDIVEALENDALIVLQTAYDLYSALSGFM